MIFTWILLDGILYILSEINLILSWTLKFIYSGDFTLQRYRGRGRKGDGQRMFDDFLVVSAKQIQKMTEQKVGSAERIEVMT